MSVQVEGVAQTEFALRSVRVVRRSMHGNVLRCIDGMPKQERLHQNVKSLCI